MTIEPEFNYSLATTPSTGSGGSHIQDASGLPAGGGCRMMMPRRRPQKTGGGMSAKSKVYSSFEDAVRDIPDGATLGFGGVSVFGLSVKLLLAVAPQCAQNLS